MAVRKIKLDEETISEILVVDTDSESKCEASGLKTIWRRNKKKIRIINSKPQQKSKHRLQQVADYQPTTASRKEHNYSFFCRSSKR